MATGPGAIIGDDQGVARPAETLEHGLEVALCAHYRVSLASAKFGLPEVNLGLLPTKGLTLPLMSFGGSSIVTNCIGIALLLRIDYENRILMRGGRA